jgi:uncharacterized membrane protein YphA (DoxX/SURF4 family)
MKGEVVDIVSLVLRLLIATVFLFAGWVKLGSPQQFADSIAAYQLLPVQVINPIALALPPLELIIGCLLLAGWQRRIAAFSALILSVVFAIALGFAISRGLTIDCGCFGSEPGSRSNLWVALFRDLLMAAALLFIYCSLLVRA